MEEEKDIIEFAPNDPNGFLVLLMAAMLGDAIKKQQNENEEEHKDA